MHLKLRFFQLANILIIKIHAFDNLAYDLLLKQNKAGTFVGTNGATIALGDPKCQISNGVLYIVQESKMINNPHFNQTSIEYLSPESATNAKLRFAATVRQINDAIENELKDIKEIKVSLLPIDATETPN